LNKGGLFCNLVPENINIIEPPFPYNCLGISPINWRFYIKHPWFFMKKIYSLFMLKKKTNLPVGQTLWPIWKDSIGMCAKKYDVAMSYIEGLPNYYVIDKVDAEKKILWIHNEYTKLGYDKDFDREYFEKADAVVTISELCRNDLVNNFLALKDKFHILENITNPTLIKKMAEEEINDPVVENKKESLKLLSIGRLYPQKNYPLAINAAKIIKDKGIDFKWYIIGEGILREEIEKQINTLSLQENITLLGLRSNPYPYIKQCDIIVQSSLFEGKSIAIDEAKILCKPIVATNYPTVYDVISDNKNGLIADMTPEALAEKIILLYNNRDLRENLSKNLKKEAIDNTSEIKNYIKLIG
jgi:glycosyltransferase involved in cell wall biosynthesis